MYKWRTWKKWTSKHKYWHIVFKVSYYLSKVGTKTS